MKARVLVAAAALAGCGETAPPQRDCLSRVWVEEAAGDARVVGSWDGWARPGAAPEPFEPGWRLLRLDLPPGEHGYLLDDGDELRLDPNNPMTGFMTGVGGEREVSLLLAADCSEPRLAIDAARADGGAITIDATFLAASSAEPVLDVRADAPLALVALDPPTGHIALAGQAGPGKHTLRVSASDAAGATASARVSLWGEGRDQRDEVIYQVMIDRYRGDGGAALPLPAHAGARAGGTLGGVEASLPALAELGATALWLSPVYRGPAEERLGKDGRRYAGYHGYWPEDTRAVEPRIGGEEALEALVASAHAAGVAVIADVVPNHVYESHERFVAHGGEGWFTPPGCVCGTDECPWFGNIERCWFAPYLPDVRWQERRALGAAVDDVAWLVDRFDLDGVRLDAVPMMPRAASRRIAKALRDAVEPDDAIFVLGEVFTGPGAGGVAELRRHLGPAGMDSVFDFPLMWAMHEVIARGGAGFEAVEEILAIEERELAGSGALLGRIVDNHDTPRFVSVANGDAHGDPWLAPAAQPTAPEPYRRLELALGLVFTLSGVPVLFQGDEIGLAGAGDPDNRRVMPPEEALSADQRAVRDTVRGLARLRRCSAALRRGERIPLEARGDLLVFARRFEAETVVVAISRANEPMAAETPIEGTFTDAADGAPADPAHFMIQPLSFRILVSGAACRL